MTPRTARRSNWLDLAQVQLSSAENEKLDRELRNAKHIQIQLQSALEAERINHHRARRESRAIQSILEDTNIELKALKEENSRLREENRLLQSERQGQEEVYNSRSRAPSLSLDAHHKPVIAGQDAAIRRFWGQRRESQSGGGGCLGGHHGPRRRARRASPRRLRRGGACERDGPVSDCRVRRWRAGAPRRRHPPWRSAARRGRRAHSRPVAYLCAPPHRRPAGDLRQPAAGEGWPRRCGRGQQRCVYCDSSADAVTVLAPAFRGCCSGASAGSNTDARLRFGVRRAATTVRERGLCFWDSQKKCIVGRSKQEAKAIQET